jgi:hypothetical protein
VHTLTNRLADPNFFARHRKCSPYWKRGFAHGVLGRGIEHPKRVGETGYRKANREYNFGYNDGMLERQHLERRFRSWERLGATIAHPQS